jgi:hypothetical protein
VSTMSKKEMRGMKGMRGMMEECGAIDRSV